MPDNLDDMLNWYLHHHCNPVVCGIKIYINMVKKVKNKKGGNIYAIINI